MDRKIGKLTLRELTGFVLLALLLTAGLLSAWLLDRQQQEIGKTLEDSLWLALSGQWENARNTADSAREIWEDRWQLWAVFADHSPMEEIDSLFSELTVYGAAGERTDFARTCAILARKMEAMGAAHRLRWWNVL